jgi:geranylgeranyl diphosphate synthase type II
MSNISVSNRPFYEFAQTHRTALEEALSKHATYSLDCPRELQAAIRHSLLSPGKRLRPLLVLMAADACGCLGEAVMCAACAVEMIHTYSLIHDDLPAMDDDDMRRGRPSCHAEFGEGTAILAGDALLAQAFQTLADGLPDDAAGRCCALLAFAAGPMALVGGQMADLAFERDQTDGNVEFLQAIHRRKTGALFLASLQMGGIIADGSSEQIESLETYGKNLGLAFQITDDLLDWQGDEQSVGKRVQKDREKGKLTFPGLLGAEESRRRAAVLIASAIGALSVFGEKAVRLESLANYVLERNR